MEELTKEALKECIMKTRDDLPMSLTTQDLMDILPFGSTKTYELLRTGEIPSKKVHGKLVIPRDKFLAWFYTTETNDEIVINVTD